MSRLKLFIENFLVYGFGSIISKLIPFIMLPFITRLMPDSYYFGLNDVAATIVSFGSAFALMGMYDAMFRMFFEYAEETYKKQICSTAFLFTCAVSFSVSICVILLRNWLADFLFGDAAYSYLVGIAALSIFTGTTNNIISAPTRMKNKRRIFLITNTAGPILSYAVSIPLLLEGHYFIALPLSALLSGVSMEIVFWIINKSWFKYKYFSWKYLADMLKIGLPLVPVTVVYWIFNSSDRLMISKLIGAQQNGIYAIGAKAGQISMLIYSAFAGGWQYFAFSTMKEKDQVKMTSSIFEYLGSISYLAAIAMAVFAEPLFHLLFNGDYVKGYAVAPYLFLAPLLQMLFQIAANQFLIIKKTLPNVLILIAGAVINVILNLLLIPAIGIEGAAAATVSGYVIAVVLCIAVLSHRKLWVLSGRFMIVTVVFLFVGMVWRFFTYHNFIGSIVLLNAMAFIYAYLYRKEIKACAALLHSHHTDT